MNYFERVSFIFSLQPKEVLELSKETLDINENTLTYREPSLTIDLPEDDCINQNERDKKIDTDSDLPIYTMDEVSYHDTFDDCWIILYDKVYDITRFLQEHPGGDDILMEYAGRDATISFRSVGHSVGALKALDEYLIGILPDRQRLFPSDSQIQWSIL